MSSFLSLVDRAQGVISVFFFQGLLGKDGLPGRMGEKGEIGIVGTKGIKVFSLCVFVHCVSLQTQSILQETVMSELHST